MLYVFIKMIVGRKNRPLW